MSIPALPSPQPIPQKGVETPSTAGKMSLKRRTGKRSFTNLQSAVTALQMHVSDALMAVVGMFIGTAVAVATGVLVQSVSKRPHMPLDARIMMLLLLGIAGVSCLAGALTMMNTLLTVINRRGREMSVRLAVGARRRDIRAQILWEAVLLSIIGGIAGGACGLLIGFVLTLSLHIPLSIDPMQIAVLISASVIVSIIFALYPVLRVAQLDYGKVLRTS